MFRVVAVAVLAIGAAVLTRAGEADSPEKRQEPAKSKADSASPLAARMAKRIDFLGDDFPVNVTLGQVLEKLGELHQVPFQVNEEAFMEASGQEDFDVLKWPIADKRRLPNLKNIPLEEIVRVLLKRVQLQNGDPARFVLREDLPAVEITTRAALTEEFYPDQERTERVGDFLTTPFVQAKTGGAIGGPGAVLGGGITGNFNGFVGGAGGAPTYTPKYGGMAEDGSTGLRRATLRPLVQVSAEMQPLDEVLRELAKSSGANVAINGKLEQARTPVTLRLSNVPLDTVVTILANMAGLKVVQLDTVLYVTSPKEAAAVQEALRKVRPTDLDEFRHYRADDFAPLVQGVPAPAAEKGPMDQGPAKKRRSASPRRRTEKSP